MEAPLSTPNAPPPSSSLASEYERHANFVWRSLQHMGVQTSDLDDGLQEVFLVAHRKYAEYDPERAKFSTWLFGICIRVARALRRRRMPVDEAEVVLVDRDTPEAACQRRQGLQVLERALAALSPEHRATFVLFEIEGEDCSSIAKLFDVPIGTVYSRLHTARGVVRSALVDHHVVASGEVP